MSTTLFHQYKKYNQKENKNIQTQVSSIRNLILVLGYGYRVCSFFKLTFSWNKITNLFYSCLYGYVRWYSIKKEEKSYYFS